MRIVVFGVKAAAFKGATARHAYIGRLWITWPFWCYLKLGIWPTIGWDRSDT